MAWFAAIMLIATLGYGALTVYSVWCFRRVNDVARVHHQRNAAIEATRRAPPHRRSIRVAETDQDEDRCDHRSSKRTINPDRIRMSA